MQHICFLYFWYYTFIFIYIHLLCLLYSLWQNHHPLKLLFRHSHTQTGATDMLKSGERGSHNNIYHLSLGTEDRWHQIAGGNAWVHSWGSPGDTSINPAERQNQLVSMMFTSVKVTLVCITSPFRLSVSLSLSLEGNFSITKMREDTPNNPGGIG